MKPLNERAVYYSAKGKRSSNQDAVAVGVLADGRSVAAVADGMGGRLAGDVASRRALEVVFERLGAGDELSHAVEEANRAVFAESNKDPELHGMGTTVVALLQVGDEYHIANVGDSRAYRLASDGIFQVTADHSFTAEAVEAGDMTPEDAVLSPWANALTRAIGTDPHVEVDVFGPFDATESHTVLLCSDGFHKPLSEEGILTSVLGCDGEDPARELTEIALRAGSDDNVTIALVSFGDESWMDRVVKARHELWDMEDAPTMEFEQEDAGGETPPVLIEEEPEEPVEGEPPEWILPDPEEAADEAELGGEILVQAGVIAEALAPVRAEPAAGAEEGEPAVAPDSAPDSSAPASAEPSEGEPVAASAESEPPSRGDAAKRPTRRGGDGFGLVVSPAPRRGRSPQSKRAVVSVVFLAAIAAAVAFLLSTL